MYFKPIGNAPEIKKKKYKLAANATVQTMIEFLKKQFKFKKEDPLVRFIASNIRQYIFINSAFQPSPDQTVGELFNVFFELFDLNLILTQCFQIDDQLLANYSISLAYG